MSTDWGSPGGNVVRWNASAGSYQAIFYAIGDRKLMVMSFDSRDEAIGALKAFEAAGMVAPR